MEKAGFKKLKFLKSEMAFCFLISFFKAWCFCSQKLFWKKKIILQKKVFYSKFPVSNIFWKWVKKKIIGVGIKIIFPPKSGGFAWQEITHPLKFVKI